MRIEADSLVYKRLRMSENSATVWRWNWPTSITILKYRERDWMLKILMKKSQGGNEDLIESYCMAFVYWRIDYTVRLRIQIQSVVIKTLIDKISKMVGSNSISIDSKTFSDRKIIFSRKSAGHVTSFSRFKAHFWWRIWWYNRNSKILN